MKKGWRIGITLLLVGVWLVFPVAVWGQAEKAPPPAAPAQEKTAPSTSPAEEKATPPAEEKAAAPAEEKPAAPAAEAEKEKKAPPASEEGYPYIVKNGDTLWEISRHFLNNPFLWPKIWDKNKYITNPNRIYPGDPLYIPGYEPKIVEAPPPPSPPAAPPTPPPAPPKKEEPAAPKPPEKVEVPPPPPELLVPEKTWRCSGYISEKYPEFPGAIIGSSKRKTVLSYADVVAINLGAKNGVKVGDKFDVLRVIRKTHYPDTVFKSVGYLVNYIGMLQAQEVIADQSRCVIIYDCEDAILGDKVSPQKEINLPLKKELTAAPEPLWGRVVEDKKLMQTHGGRDVLFIDLGTNQGVGPGDVFEVFRPYDRSIIMSLFDSGQRSSIEETTPGGKDVIYSMILGRVLVIRSEPNTSVCLIQDYTQELQVGYRVKWAQKAKP